MESSLEIAKFTAIPRVRITSGEILEDGTIIDPVAAADGDGLDLLSWDCKETPRIGPALNHGGIIYQPPDLHPTVREAMMFPKGAVEYDTIAQLFRKISCLFPEHAGMPEDLAAFMTCWVLSSWIPEFMAVRCGGWEYGMRANLLESSCAPARGFPTDMGRGSHVSAIAVYRTSIPKQSNIDGIHPGQDAQAKHLELGLELGCDTHIHVAPAVKI